MDSGPVARSTPSPAGGWPSAAARGAVKGKTGVEVDNLGKRFGEVEAVRGLTFRIGEGEAFGLLGPNGAGKSTTLLMLSTLLRPSFGDARVFGQSLAANVRAVRRLVGLVPQDVSLYPDMSARENLAFFGRLYGLSPRRVQARAEELLGLVGLTGRADDPVETYSGGMKRRLNLACGLVHEPRLLLLDEPTVGVDPQSRENILAAIQAIARRGTTVLYTTHYMEEAERVCDRIAIMDEGRVIACGTLTELLNSVDIHEVIEIRGAWSDGDQAPLRALPEVTTVERTGNRTRIWVTDAARALAPIAAMLAERHKTIEGLEIHPVNLERVFMHLTGKALRD